VLLSQRACLLILDDAWHIDHITAFGATGHSGAAGRFSSSQHWSGLRRAANGMYR
jgi:hypothetical protein